MKGATHPGVSLRCSPAMSHFNPRTREGCDNVNTPAVDSDFGISIHAPVKGATILQIFTIIHLTNFNPRTREGCDYDKHISWYYTWHFNPRTREGCDKQMLFALKDDIQISIHAPVKGATAFKLAQSLSALSSIILRADWKAVQFLSQLSGYCSFL